MWPDTDVVRPDNKCDDEDDGRKIGSSECDGLPNDVNEEIDGVLIDNTGSYPFRTNGSPEGGVLLVSSSFEFVNEALQSQS